MPAIHATNHTAPVTLHANLVPSAPRARTAADTVKAIDTKYPNLAADLGQARDDVSATEGTDTWAGLNWMEKAVFFLLPFGPLLGLVLMSQNGDIHRQAVKNLRELEDIVQLRAALITQMNHQTTDRAA